MNDNSNYTWGAYTQDSDFFVGTSSVFSKRSFYTGIPYIKNIMYFSVLYFGGFCSKNQFLTLLFTILGLILTSFGVLSYISIISYKKLKKMN